MHPDRKKIEDDIAHGVPYEDVVKKYGEFCTVAALSNHKRKHMGIENPASARLARMDFALTPAIHQAARVADMLWEIAETAKNEKNYRTAVSALKEYRAAIALKAQLTGEARTRGPNEGGEFLKIVKHLESMTPEQINAMADRAVALQTAKSDALALEGEIVGSADDEPY